MNVHIVFNILPVIDLLMCILVCLATIQYVVHNLSEG